MQRTQVLSKHITQVCIYGCLCQTNTTAMYLTKPPRNHYKIHIAFALVWPNAQGDLESVASLFGRITALRQGGPEHPTSEEKKDEGAPLDAHVRVVMRTMKERLASLREAPLQASG